MIDVMSAHIAGLHEIHGLPPLLVHIWRGLNFVLGVLFVAAAYVFVTSPWMPRSRRILMVSFGLAAAVTVLVALENWDLPITLDYTVPTTVWLMGGLYGVHAWIREDRGKH